MIASDIRRLVYDKAIKKYGTDRQTIKAIEELSELQKELSKFLLGVGNLDSLMEEIADVTIMIEQLALIYPSTKLESLMDYKINRLSKRLEGKDNV